MTWVSIPDLGKGLNLDGTPEELASGVTTSGTNVRFRAGYAERFKGFETVYTTPVVTPYHITMMTAGTSRYVVYAGLAKTYVDDGATQTDITNADNTGAIDDRYTGGIFNGVYVQNNGVDVPQYWGGNTASNLANLTAWPAGYTAGFLRPYKNYLVAGDITKSGTRYPQLMLTSHLADPGTIPTSWDASDATKDAVENPLAETNGTLIDCLPFGDLNVVYKDDAVHFMQTVNSRDIFRWGRLPGDTGLLSRGCVVAIPGAHVLLTPDLDVVVYDLQNMRSILNGRMKRWLAENINEPQAVRSFLVASPATYEVLICIPHDAATVCTRAIVWNYKDDTFAIRELANVTYAATGKVTLASGTTWASATGTWETVTESWGDFGDVDGTARVIFTGTAPRLSMYDSTELDNGSSFTATLERTGMHFDNPDVVKLCRGVRPKIDAANGTVVKVQIGAAMVPDSSPTWQTAQDFTVGTDVEVHSFTSGRYLSLRFYTTGDTPWRVRSCSMDIVPQGAY